MNNTHPSQNILDQFASGELDDKLSILVSVHVSSCSHCKGYLAQKENQLSEAIFASPLHNKGNQIDFSDIQENILKLKKSSDTGSSAQCLQPVETLEIRGKELELPHQLTALKSQMQPWKNIGDKITYSKINVHGPNHLYFVYFDQGAKIPQHTHEGNEYAYVIAGSFNDQSSEYITGDFASFGTSDAHHPQTDDPDGCLLIVSLDAPFIFQEGWARMLNPFRKWLL